MISCSKCKKATLPITDGGCIRTGGIVDIGCEFGEPRIITNYDLLIHKSPEELAEHYKNRGCPPNKRCPPATELRDIRINDVCTKCWLDWLKQEATHEP